MQKVSQRGLTEIASHEAIVLSPYKDKVGRWTIGIGHTASAGPPDPAVERRKFSVKEIMTIFSHDIQKFEARVRRSFTRALSQEQFDAAVSFDFNTGGIYRASWVKHFNKGMGHAKVRKAFMAWRKPKEIIPRRKAECTLFFDNHYSSKNLFNTYLADNNGTVLWHTYRQINLPSIMNPVDGFGCKLKGWRTVIANVLMSIMPVLELTELLHILPNEYLPWYALSVALINAWLRSITTSPVGRKQ